MYKQLNDLGYTLQPFKQEDENNSAFRLYQKVGFKTIGTIPKAILNADKTYQDGYIMYRSLEDI
jgi:ribosomal protein S18 acetylase RimI-like enzyme